MEIVAGSLGVVLVVVAVADLVNTLVTTSTSVATGWPSWLVARSSYRVVRAVAARLPRGRLREGLLATFAPLLLLLLLAMWVTLQVIGFGLVWWASAGIDGATDLGESLYYSAVVFFTVGFGDVVPEAVVPRFGSMVEAFLGVISVALVIGYLPSLYAAYSERERALMTLDDGSGERITPLSLVAAWSPDADPKKLEARFERWEDWTTHILETHATLPLLRYFRSHEERQHWVTALGLLTDSALVAQIVLGAYDGRGYWFIRRATHAFDEMTIHVPEQRLQPYRDALAPVDEPAGDGPDLFRQLYEGLEAHGFDLVPFEEARTHARTLRATYAPQMEYLIDDLLAPRGFWSTERATVPLLSTQHPELLDYQPPDHLRRDRPRPSNDPPGRTDT